MFNENQPVRYSFVISAYNYADYIMDAVNSVLAQAVSRNDVEVVVVDDGSTDDTWFLLKSMSEKEPRLRAFFQENRGPAAARNAGAEKARGEFVWFLDADDCLADRAIDAFDRVVDEFPGLDMLFGGYQSFSREKEGRKNIPVMGLRDSRAIFRKAIFSELCGLCVGSSIIRRETFVRVGFPEGVHNSEDAVMYSLVISIGKVFSIDKVVVKTRRHEDSLRGSMEKNLESGFKAASCLFGNPLLPAEYKRYRSRFVSYRYLEMSRLYYLSGMNRDSSKMYLAGIAMFPGNIFLFSYLRKFLKVRFRMVFS